MLQNQPADWEEGHVSSTRGALKTLVLSCALLVPLASSCSDDPSHPHVPPDTRVPEYYTEWETNIWSYMVDDAGNLHVSQFDDPAILKYSSEGALLEEWFVVLNGDTLDISGLTQTKDHFVALGWSNVVVLDANYDVVNSWPEHNPRDATSGGDLIDADPSGNIFVLDDNRNRVDKYGFDGTFKLEWGIDPQDSIAGDFLTGIAVTEAGQVCVAQGGRNRILVYSSEGRLITTFGRQGNAPAQFSFPLGIDASQGLIYIADTGNIRVKKFTLSGVYLSDFYSLGTYGSDIDVPRSIALYGNYVFVMHGRSIIRYDYSH